MGNAIAGKRRTARVMKVDGSTRKYRPPAVASDALRDHPTGHQCHLLESDEVRRLGVRARPLDPDAPLKPGKLYFLVDLPRPASSSRAPRRTWSGALTYGGGSGSDSGGGAGERLESLMLARRSASDVAATVKAMAAAAGSVGVESPGTASVEAGEDGAVRLRVRLPKAEVARLVKESRDAAEAAERIMRLCVDRDHQRLSAPATPVMRLPPAPPVTMPAPAIASSRNKKGSNAAATAGAKKEKRARFVTVPDEIIGF